jgi:molybdate transport system ATP-binding protein
MMSDTISVVLDTRLGDFRLQVDFSLPVSGVTVVFGRSGSGKTVLLRCLAGLLRPSGRVQLGSRVFSDSAAGIFLRPERRKVGFVFQQAALFPHLSVRGNLQYALARTQTTKPGIGLQQAAEWLRLGALLERDPKNLSGGEQQRVAIARALVSSPDLLLMDEPLASLDVEAKLELLELLANLRRELNVPIFYVTHSVGELTSLAERVLWLRDGRLLARGSPGAVLSRMDLARTLGSEASGCVSAQVSRQLPEHHLTELDSAWGKLFVRRMEAVPRQSVTVRVRADDVSLSLERETKSSILNVFEGVVERVEPSGPGEALVSSLPRNGGAEALLARVTQKSAVDLGLTKGLPVFVRAKSVSVRP